MSTYFAGSRAPRGGSPARAAAVRGFVLAVLGALLLEGCGSAEMPDEAALRARFEALHRRLYEVYSVGSDRDALWRFLAESFAGEQLTDEYVEHFTALRRMEREQTAIRVLEVDYEAVALRREGESIVVDADWSVGGVVTHQRHRHPRINRYRATYVLADADGAAAENDLDRLRIVETTLRSLDRVTSARSAGFPLDELPASARGSLSLSDLLRSGAVAAEESGERDDEGRPAEDDGRP